MHASLLNRALYSYEEILDKFDIGKLTYKPAKEVAQEMLAKREQEKASPATPKDLEGLSLWHLIKSVKPVDIYCYLNARFGPPNGMQMLFKSNDSDNLFQWHYTLHYEEERIEIMCTNYRIEVMHSFAFPDHQFAVDQFLLDIKRDYQNYKKEISDFRKTLEKWNIFVNPFFHNKSVMEYQVNALDELKIDSLSDVPETITEDNQKYFNEIAVKYTQATALAFSIRMLAPVYAESFVNTLIFLLADDDVKKDKRLYDSIIRQNIDIRVKQLHRNCNGFVHPVDYNNVEACKKLHTLFNNRNDLLHGNIDPKKSVYDTFYFQGKTPLPLEFKNMFTQAHSASMNVYSPKQALQDYEVVQDFIAYVLMCLDEKLDKQVRHFLETQNPGWNDKTGRVGILFPQHYADSHIGVSIPITKSS